MAAGDESKLRKAILVLEDDDLVRDAWTRILQEDLGDDVYVCSAPDAPRAQKEVERAEGYGHCFVLVIVDQVLDGDRKAGPAFLRKFKTTHPDALRMMISSKSDREEIQGFLDEGLINHYQDKTAFAGETALTQAFQDKVRDMLAGRSRGNVSDPDFERRFEEQMRKWFGSLPEGEETEVEWMSGKRMRAKEILDDNELMASLRHGYLTSSLHGLFADAD